MKLRGEWKPRPIAEGWIVFAFPWEGWWYGVAAFVDGHWSIGRFRKARP